MHAAEGWQTTLNTGRRRRGARADYRNLKGLDERLGAQTCQPLFLQGLRFFLEQFFLDLISDGSERPRDTAMFVLDSQEIKIAAEFNDVAHFPDGQVKRTLL